MSIHKSKGLEFPVVFLCDTGSKFNNQDFRNSILLHQDIGFGPKYINYDRKITYNTLARSALKIKSNNETLAEQMRVLYVALTRSREKLIITGIDKDYNKSSMSKVNDIVTIKRDKKIPTYIVKKAKSFLDWIELSWLYDNDSKEVLDVFIHNKNEIQQNEITKEQEYKIDENKMENNNYNEVKKLLEWKYDKENLSKIEGKTSVSKIAKNKEDKIEITSKPKVFLEESKVSGAELGTATHLILQKMNFKEQYTSEKIIDLIQSLVMRNILTDNVAKKINVQTILNFTNSEIYNEIGCAKEIHKEEAFYLNIPVKELYNIDEKENVLVQGIIDLYYINNNDEVILLDYKTDYVPKNDENYLIEKYRPQLLLYKRALEKALNKKVEKIYIYSTYMSKTISI